MTGRTNGCKIEGRKKDTFCETERGEYTPSSILVGAVEGG